MSKAPMPKPKKTIQFPDIDKIDDRTKLHKEILDVVLRFRSEVRKGETMNALAEFASAIVPGSFADPGRLPRGSPNGRSKAPHKEECLLAAVSDVIQAYWGMCLDTAISTNTEKSAIVILKLNKLREILRVGLFNCWVEGSDREGYVLRT